MHLTGGGLRSWGSPGTPGVPACLVLPRARNHSSAVGAARDVHWSSTRTTRAPGLFVRRSSTRTPRPVRDTIAFDIAQRRLTRSRWSDPPPDDHRPCHDRRHDASRICRAPHHRDQRSRDREQRRSRDQRRQQHGSRARHQSSPVRRRSDPAPHERWKHHSGQLPRHEHRGHRTTRATTEESG